MAVTAIIVLLVVLALIIVPLALKASKKEGKRDLPGRHPSPSHPIREDRPLTR